MFTDSSAPVPLLLVLGLRNAAVVFVFDLSSCWLPAGDIAFRFLNYVQAQHQRKQKRQSTLSKTRRRNLQKPLLPRAFARIAEARLKKEIRSAETAERDSDINL